MKKLVYWIAGTQLQWLLLSETGQLEQTGESLLGEPIELGDDIKKIRQQYLLLPGYDVGVKNIQFAAEEKRHIVKTLPYQLEEQLPCDIDQLLIVNQKPTSNSVLVAYINETLLEDYIDIVRAMGLRPIQAVPEQLFFEELVSVGTWVQVADRLIIPSAQTPLVVSEAEISVLLEDSGVEPPQTLLSLSDEVFNIQGQSLEPQLLSDFSSCHTPLNFMVGRFTDSQDLVKIWKFSKPLAIAASVVAVLYSVVLGFEYQQLKTENIELRRSIETEFRKVQSKGSVYQPKKQMEKLLAAYGAGQSSGFSAIFAALAPPLARQKSLELDSLAYDQKNGELRLELKLNDFAALEQLQKDIAAAALKVELQNSSTQGNKLHAKIKVRRAG